MSKSIIKTIKTITLRRIDPVSFLRRYLAGEFVNVKIPVKKIKISSFVNLNQKIGTDQTSEIYKFRNKTNSGQMIVTTNHKNFHSKTSQSSNSSQNQKTQITPVINYCIWCRRLIKDQPIGIPVSMEHNRKTKETVFYVEDSYCGFSCALAGLKRLRSCHRLYKDPMYMDADQMLHLMYHKAHQTKKGTRIVEAKNWRLLDINGGPLSDSEYDNKSIKYTELSNLVLSSVKRQYIKLKV